MSNVIQMPKRQTVRPAASRPAHEATSENLDGVESPVSRKLLKSALTRLLVFARSEKMENTAMTLELALTAVDVDCEAKRV